MFLVKEIMMFTKKKLKIIIDENNAIILGTGTGVSSAAVLNMVEKIFIKDYML